MSRLSLKTTKAREEYDRVLAEAKAKYDAEVAAVNTTERSIVNKALEVMRMAAGKQQDIQKSLKKLAVEAYHMTKADVTRDKIDNLLSYYSMHIDSAVEISPEDFWDLGNSNCLEVSKTIGTPIVGDCRRVSQLVARLKTHYPMPEPVNQYVDSPHADPRTWSINQVAKWTRESGLEDLAPYFIEHKVAGDVLFALAPDISLPLMGVPVHLVSCEVLCMI